MAFVTPLFFSPTSRSIFSLILISPSPKECLGGVKQRRRHDVLKELDPNMGPLDIAQPCVWLLGLPPPFSLPSNTVSMNSGETDAARC